MDANEAESLSIPRRFLQPVLPSPRYVQGDVVESRSDGVPKMDPALFVFRCRQPMEILERTEPGTAEYIRDGERQGVSRGYLASRRNPWYALDAREGAPFVCTYMGRSTGGEAPFRMILNESQAIATNVYLMMYPKKGVERAMTRASGRRAVLAALQRSVQRDWKDNGRVYGGGLYKMEPKELGRLSANLVLRSLPG